MKIARYEILYADAGFCNACFLKITTDDGLDRLVGIRRAHRHAGHLAGWCANNAT